jgi:O-antigen/teichoic acid export membrane protein
VLDRIVIGATHFVIGLTLARHGDPSEYGAYVLAFAMLLFCEDVQGKLIGLPMTVIGAAKDANEFPRYVSALLLVQMLGGGALTLLSFGVVGITSWLAVNPSIQGAVLGLAPALFFMLPQLFCRKVLFARLLPGQVLLNDLLLTTLQLGGLAVFIHLDMITGTTAQPWLTARNMLLLLAGAAFLATLLGLYQIRHFLTRHLTDARQFLHETWDFGKWGLGMQLGQFIMLRSPHFIVSAFAGPAGAALLAAPRLIVQPLLVLAVGVEGVLRPRAAQKYAEGGVENLLRFIVPAALVPTLIFIAFGVLIAAAPTFWLQLFFGDNYIGAEGVLVLWVVIFITQEFVNFPHIALTSARRPDLAMYGTVLAGAVMIVLALALAPLYEVRGVMVATLLSRMLWAGSLLWFCFLHLTPKEASERPVRVPIPETTEA